MYLSIVSDFEKASVSAAKSFLPDARYKGCLFHFGQIIWRKVYSNGCATKYGTNEELSLKYECLRAWRSFLKIKRAATTHYAELKKKHFGNDGKKIDDWFEKNYISGNLKRKRNSAPAAPMYAPDLWSI